jgi:hypothetical protein
LLAQLREERSAHRFQNTTAVVHCWLDCWRTRKG